MLVGADRHKVRLSEVMPLIFKKKDAESQCLPEAINSTLLPPPQSNSMRFYRAAFTCA